MKYVLLSCALILTIQIKAQWQEINTGIITSLDAVVMISHDELFVGGVEGIQHSTDGGNSWTLRSSGNEAISDIFFIDVSNAVAVGDDGVILISQDGGLSWSGVNSGTGADLEAVHFPSSNIGYIAGRDGVILKTTDGGSSWTSQGSGTTERLEDVWFTSSDDGFIAGREGVFLFTVDGGSTWTSNSIYGDDLKALHFINSNTGFVSGDDGVLFKTSDGGSSWIQVNSDLNNEVGAIWFVDTTRGYTAGDLGTIGASDDGGSSWSVDTTIGFAELNDIHFFDANNGCIVGDGGTLIKFGNISTAAYQLEESEVRIYPNPARDKIFINGLDQIDHLTLTDITGKMHLSETGRHILQLGELNAGNYILTIQSGEETLRRKIQIQ